MRNVVFAAALSALVGACGKGGGDADQAFDPGPFSCPVFSYSQAESENSMRPSSVAQADESDPFQRHGKVIIGQTSSSGGMRAFAQHTVRDLPAGTELTVTLRESCERRGEISSQLLSSEDLSTGPAHGGVRDYTWALPSPSTISRLQAEAQVDECVIGISDSVITHVKADVKSEETLDPLIGNQGHLRAIQAQDSYPVIFSEKPARVEPVVIAIIDTGVDTNHPDIRNVLWQNAGEVAGNKIDDDGNGFVDDVNGYNFGNKTGDPRQSTWSGAQHGTHVAGLAAAQNGNGVGVSGVMGSGARIMALNVFGARSGAYSADTANAIRYAADNGAAVINLSLGGSGRSAAYESALVYALKKGATIFAAAGNERSQLNESYFMTPASYSAQYPGLIAIGSVDSSSLGFSMFSNFNPIYVKLAAPGSEDSSARRGLLSTWPGENYSRVQGTSMSTPVASGSAALAIHMMRGLGYSPSPATIEGVLSVSARKIASLRSQVRDGRVLNLKNLADFIQKTYPARDPAQGPIDPGVPGYQPCAVTSPR